MNPKEWLKENGMNIIRQNPEERQEGYLYSSEIVKVMEEYARQVAIQVREKCAENVRFTWSKTKRGKLNRDLVIDKESILATNIEQFLV